MNIVLLSGRLTRDPDQRYTASNTAVASFGLAVDRRDADNTTDFFSCTAWKKTAELIAKYCHKGDKITLRGRLQVRKWEDNDGKKHEVTEIVVDEVEFSPKTNAEPKPEPKPEPKKEIPEPGYFDGLDNIDTPF